MKNSINITISLDKEIDKQNIVAAISQILNISDFNIYFFYSHNNRFDANNTLVFVNYIPLTHSQLAANINISIVKSTNTPSRLSDIDFSTSLSKLLNANVYIPAPLSYKYSIIKIEPSGELYGANEYETEEEFEYLYNITLLDAKAIKKLKTAIKKDIIEEELITEHTQLGI